MQDNPPGRSCKNRVQRPRNSRFTCEEITDSVDCSGEYCRSCAASLIADCVAVCCCPLALASLLALAFVKVPYMLGRKCWRRRKNKNKNRKCKKLEAGNDHDIVISGRLSQAKSDIVFEFEDIIEFEERRSFCAAFEADKVLMELYQIGHLGFGRVSFTGIQSFEQGN